MEIVMVSTLMQFNLVLVSLVTSAVANLFLQTTVLIMELLAILHFFQKQRSNTKVFLGLKHLI